MLRRYRCWFFDFACISAGLFCAAVLIGVLIALITAGLPALDLGFLTRPAQDFGSGGGILYQLIGSLLLVLGACLIAGPMALGTALYKSECLRSERSEKMSELLLHGLNGVPSVIHGLFGLILFVNLFGMGISWSAGSLVLAIMILPTITLASYQSIRSIPQEEREAAFSLGLNKWERTRKLMLPRASKGLLTGLLLGLGRAIGETAPIMFIATAFSGAGLPASMFEPVASMPTHILTLAQQAADPKALEQAWGTALVLVLCVMGFSLSGLFLRKRYQSLRA